jgi:membrane associated rhomboid family serine protease
MSLTVIIILITIGASMLAWSKPDLYEKWMMNPYRIKNNHEYYRFITSGFIHTGYMHLGFNMLAMYFFGRPVEGYFNTIEFLVLYIVGIVVSDISTYIKFQNHPSYRSLGASGAVSAIIFSSILVFPLDTIYIYFIPMNAFIFGILYLIYSYYQAKGSTDNINHDAHFYGAVFGIVYTFILIPGVLTDFFREISSWQGF